MYEFSKNADSDAVEYAPSFSLCCSNWDRRFSVHRLRLVHFLIFGGIMFKLFRVLRIAFKLLVWASAIFLFLAACMYWLDGARLAAIPLLAVALLTFVLVLKDRSEDRIRKKARDAVPENAKDFYEDAVMLTVYMCALILWILSIALSSYLMP